MCIRGVSHKQKELSSMEFFISLLSNHMLLCAVVSYFLAQIIKILLCIVREHRLDLKLMFASGGMPSSHASTVTALCISSGRNYGIGSPFFAITFVLASVVMYDAAGVRRAAGEHAKVLNRLLADLTSGDPAVAEASLKELIGHTPFQVLMGAVLGAIIAFVIPLP